MTDDARRTRSKARKRRAQNRPAPRTGKAATTADRTQKIVKRRRRTAESAAAERALPRTSRADARIRGRSSQKSRKPQRARRGR
jgi:hypothetical protein